MQAKVVEFNIAARTVQNIYRAGDVVKVHRKIKEGEKERIQIFEGMVIAMKGGQSSSPMMTVRKVSQGGYGVEIVVPINSPMIEKIDLVKRAKVRRSKLYYVRDKAAKALRFKFTDGDKIVHEVPEALAQEAEAEPVVAEVISDVPAAEEAPVVEEKKETETPEKKEVVDKKEGK